MSSVEKALLMLRNLPRVGLNTIRDLPEAAKNRKAKVFVKNLLNKFFFKIKLCYFSIIACSSKR